MKWGDKGWSHNVDNKMRAFGDIDYDKKKIRVNKKRSKKTAKGEVLDSMVHEETHRKHPKMREKNVSKKAEADIKKMGKKQKAKHYSKYSKPKKRKRGQPKVTGKVGQAKVATVMREFEAGTLTSHGKKVTDRDQALAIAMSEGRRVGKHRKKKKAPTRAIKTDGWILPKSKEELAELRKRRRRRKQ